MREPRGVDRRAAFRRWLTALSLVGIAFEIVAGHFHDLILRGADHGPNIIQTVAVLLVLAPAALSVAALVPHWRVDPAGPLDQDVALCSKIALATLLIGGGIHLALAWEQGPALPGLRGLVVPLIRHGPPAMAPLLAAAMTALTLAAYGTARERRPDREAMATFALAATAAAAAAALDHARMGFRPLPWTLLGPAVCLWTAWVALRFAVSGGGPLGAGPRRTLFLLLPACIGVGVTGTVLHVAADLSRHPDIPLMARLLTSPPAAAPALLVLLGLWGLYLITGRDALVWWR